MSCCATLLTSDFEPFGRRPAGRTGEGCGKYYRVFNTGWVLEGWYGMQVAEEYDTREVAFASFKGSNSMCDDPVLDQIQILTHIIFAPLEAPFTYLSRGASIYLTGKAPSPSLIASLEHQPLSRIFCNPLLCPTLHTSLHQACLRGWKSWRKLCDFVEPINYHHVSSPD